MQIKPKMRYHFTPLRMAIIKDKKQQVLAVKWRKGTLLHSWWEYKLVQPLCKLGWRFLKKLRVALPYDPAIPLLDIYPKNTKT